MIVERLEQLAIIADACAQRLGAAGHFAEPKGNDELTLGILRAMEGCLRLSQVVIPKLLEREEPCQRN